MDDFVPTLSRVVTSIRLAPEYYHVAALELDNRVLPVGDSEQAMGEQPSAWFEGGGHAFPSYNRMDCNHSHKGENDGPSNERREERLEGSGL